MWEEASYLIQTRADRRATLSLSLGPNKDARVCNPCRISEAPLPNEYTIETPTVNRSFITMVQSPHTDPTEPEHR